MIHNNTLFNKCGALFMVWLLLLLPFSSALSITNVNSVPNTNSAVISFNTDETTTGLVTVNGKGDFPVPSDPISVGQSHSIAITGLSPSTTYTYTAKAASTTSSALNSSPQKTFTTLAASGEIFLTPDINTIANSNKMTYVGKTLPDAIVTVYVNDVVSKVVIASATGDVSATFNLNTELAQNTIRIQVQNPATSQTKDFSQVVTIDTLYPEFLNLTIPSVSASSSVQITGTTNKAMSVTAYVMYPDGREKDFGPADVSGAGDFDLNVELDDGENKVLVRGTDISGGQVEEEQTVTVDSEELELDIDFSLYDPIASSTLYIDGFVNKPGIDVRVYVDPKDKRVGKCDTVESVTVTPSQTIEDSQCYGFRRFDQVTVDGAYFESKSSTTANKDGMYPVSIKVQLEPRLSIYSEDELATTATNPTGAVDAANQENRFNAGTGIGLAEEYSMFAVATDNVGRVETTSTSRLRKEQCGDTGDFMVRIGNVYPDLIQPDHIFQGIAQISFKADLQYTGAYDYNSVVVTGAGITARQVSDFDLEKLGTDPQKILEPGRCKISPASGIEDYVYMTCDLNRFPTSEVRTNITAAYKKLESIGSIKFPVTFSVDYSYQDNYNRTVSRKATQCVDIAIRFDKRLSPDKYPKGLLKSTVKVLNTTVVAIDKVLKPLNTIKLVTLGACVGSKAFSLFSDASEEFTCAKDSLTFQIPQIEQVLRGCSSLTDDTCKTNLNKIRPEKKDGELDVAETICSYKINSRLKNEKVINNICDRIFCPSVPSATEYIKKVNNNPRLKIASACSRGESNVWTDASGSVANLKSDVGCGKEYQDMWKSACPTANPLQASQDQLKNSAERGTQITSFSQVISNLNFCSANQDTLGKKPDAITTNGVTYFNENVNDPKSCYSLGIPQTNSQFDKTKGDRIRDPNSITELVNHATINGDLPDTVYTSDKNVPCVVTASDGSLIYQFKDNFNQPLKYDAGQASVITVTEGSQKNELSAVMFGGKEGVLEDGSKALGSDGVYYQKVNDKWSAVDPKKDVEGTFFKRACSTPTTAGNPAEFGIFNPKKVGNTVSSTEGENGCNAIRQAPNELKQENAAQYIIIPTDGLINSFRCACLPAIEGYLIVWRNVFNAVKNCFQATLVNGEFKSGACRSLLTTYICDWIYRAIKCVTNFAGNIEGLKNKGTQERQTGIGAIQSLQKGADRMSSAMQSRYGNTATFNSLIGSRKIINSVCLAAFGYDWLPELDAAVSIKGGGAAINSTAFIVTADRRWVSSDPTTGYAKFIYEAGYFISAGSPLSYKVELVCSNDYSCKTADGYATAACDCAQGTDAKERVKQVDVGNANGGQTVGDSDGKGQRFIPVAEEKRYDKVRMTFTDTVTPGAQPQIVERSISRIGGQEPPTCTFSVLTFNFQCDYVSTNKYGDVFFYGEKIKFEKDPYDMNEPLNLAAFVKVDYNKKVGLESQPISPNLQLTKYAKLEIWNAGETQQISPSEIYDLNELYGTGKEFITLGSGYHVGSGIVPKGIRGTFAIANPQAGTSSYEYVPGTNKIELDTNSLSTARAISKSRYYAFLIKKGTALDLTNKDQETPQKKFEDNLKKVVQEKDVIVTFVQAIDSINSVKASSLQDLIDSAYQVQTQVASKIAVVVAPKEATLASISKDPAQSSQTPIMDIDSGNTVQVRLGDSLDSALSPGISSAVIDFSVQSASSLLCAPNQRSVDLVARVSLHDSRAKDKKLDISKSNSQFSEAVFVYQGKPQNVSQAFTVNCPGYDSTGSSTQKSNLLRCAPNKIINSRDYPQKTGVIVQDGGCYCSDENNNQNIFSTSSSSMICLTEQSDLFNQPFRVCSNGVKSDQDCVCVSENYQGIFKYTVPSLYDSQNNLVQFCEPTQTCKIAAGSIIGVCS